jgi:opacity protein-like surface antigen
MKSRIATSVVFLLIAASAFAADVAATQSDAQKSFDQLKTLAGEWEGSVTVPDAPEMSGAKMHLSLRVTSRGNALVHEMQEAGTPLDATKYDHPVTMLYVDGDQLTLVHYCDAGNRPRMTGKMSPDGKTVEFELKDISGSTEMHMHHSVFTVIDANHHTEDWTFMMKDKPIHAHFDLQRTK